MSENGIIIQLKYRVCSLRLLFFCGLMVLLGAWQFHVFLVLKNLDITHLCTLKIYPPPWPLKLALWLLSGIKYQMGGMSSYG